MAIKIGKTIHYNNNLYKQNIFNDSEWQPFKTFHENFHDNG